MIFINNAKKKIGKYGLIINQKANNFYEKDALRPEDFHRLFDVFTKFLTPYRQRERSRLPFGCTLR